MSIENRPKLNRLIDSVSGLPLVHGDYYRPADRIIDVTHAEGMTGDFLSQVLTTPSVLSGLVVTINGVNSQTIDITAGIAVGYDPQILTITEHQYDGASLSGLDATTGYTHPVNAASGLKSIPRFINIETALTAQPTTSIGVGLSGYVKLRYKDQNLFTRNTPSDPTGTAYSFLTRDYYELIIDTIAPTAVDVCLGNIQKDAFGAITAVTTTNRNVATGLQLKNGFLDLPNGFRLNLNDANQTANRIYTLQDRNMTIAGTDDITKLYVTASANITAGTVVTITGDDTGNSRPNAAMLTTSFQIPVGIAESAISNAAGGYITIAGRVVTTLNATTAAVGDPVYATSTGALTLTRTLWKVGIVATNTANAVIYCNFDFTEDFFKDGTVSAPAISWLNETNSGRYRIASNQFGEAINGVQVSEINTLGVLNGTLGTEYRNILQIVNHDSAGQNNGTSTKLLNTTAYTMNGSNHTIICQGFITPKSSSSRIIITGTVNFGANANSTTINMGYLYRHTSSQGNVGSIIVSPAGTLIGTYGSLVSIGGSSWSIANNAILGRIIGHTAGTQIFITFTVNADSTNGFANANNTTSEIYFMEVI